MNELGKNLNISFTKKNKNNAITTYMFGFPLLSLDKNKYNY